MTYKTDLLNIVRHYLNDKHGRKYTTRVLGGWNDPSRKSTRQAAIDESIVGIKKLIDEQDNQTDERIIEILQRLEAISDQITQLQKDSTND